MAIEKALAVAAKALERVGGKEVEYRSGAAKVFIPAVKGRTSHNRYEQTQVIETVQSIDWLIRPELLELYGRRHEPKPNDKIIEVAGEKRFVYEVTSMPGGSTWRWADASRTRMRVYTILVKESQA